MSKTDLKMNRSRFEHRPKLCTGTYPSIFTRFYAFQIDDKYNTASAFLRDELLPNLCPAKTRAICEGASSTPIYREERAIIQGGNISRTSTQSGDVSRPSMASRKETDAVMKNVIKQYVL